MIRTIQVPEARLTYEYTNPHPKGKKNLGDCVYRAISITTGKDWLTVYDELTKLGRALLAPPNDTKVITAYLSKIAVKVPAIVNGKRLTGSDIAFRDPEGVYVISTAHHLSAIREGKVRDTWDSGSKSAYIVWKLQ